MKNSETQREPREITERFCSVEDCTNTGEFTLALSQRRSACCVREIFSCILRYVQESFWEGCCEPIQANTLLHIYSYQPAPCLSFRDCCRECLGCYMPGEDYGNYCKHIKVSPARRKNDSACLRGRRWRRGRDILRCQVGGYPQTVVSVSQPTYCCSPPYCNLAVTHVSQPTYCRTDRTVVEYTTP